MIDGQIILADTEENATAEQVEPNGMGRGVLELLQGQSRAPPCDPSWKQHSWQSNEVPILWHRFFPRVLAGFSDLSSSKPKAPSHREAKRGITLPLRKSEKRTACQDCAGNFFLYLFADRPYSMKQRNRNIVSLCNPRLKSSFGRSHQGSHHQGSGRFLTLIL